jgi:hypothetical protein
MKFITFGCWNNNDCKNSETPLYKTMEKLKDVISKDTYSHIIISGDNYYPKKNEINNKKIKTINPNNFFNGFNCLPTEIEKIILLGNHEIEDMFDNFKEVGLTSSECSNLNLQKTISIPNFSLFNDVMSIKQDNCLIIMFDSTLYLTDNDDTLIENTCYKHLFNYPNNSSINIAELKKYQTNKITELLQNNDKENIVFIAHHPIFYGRNKKSKDNFYLENNLSILMQNLKEYFINKNIYYLCADIHNYQKGIIEFDDFIINQFIVGTGGAELDEIPNDNDFLIDGISYTIEEKIKNNGFISFDTENCEVIFYQIPFSAGNYYHKYLKYKQKYLSLKK